MFNTNSQLKYDTSSSISEKGNSRENSKLRHLAYALVASSSLGAVTAELGGCGTSRSQEETNALVRNSNDKIEQLSSARNGFHRNASAMEVHLESAESAIASLQSSIKENGLVILNTAFEGDMYRLVAAQCEARNISLLSLQGEIQNKYNHGERYTLNDQQIVTELTKRDLKNLAERLGVSAKRADIIVADVTNSFGDAGKTAASELGVNLSDTQDALTVNENHRSEALFRMGATRSIATAYAGSHSETPEHVNTQMANSIALYDASDRGGNGPMLDYSTGINGKEPESTSTIKERAKELGKKAAEQAAKYGAKMGLTELLTASGLAAAVAKPIAGTLVSTLWPTSTATTGDTLPSDPSDLRALEMASFIRQEMARLDAERARGNGGPDYSHPGLRDGSGGRQPDGGIKGWDKNDHIDKNNPGGFGNIG